MITKLLPECCAGAVEPHHRVVGTQAKFDRDFRHRYAVEHYPAQNLRVLGFELLCLNDRTPAVDFFLLDRRQFNLIDW